MSEPPRFGPRNIHHAPMPVQLSEVPTTPEQREALRTSLKAMPSLNAKVLDEWMCGYACALANQYRLDHDAAGVRVHMRYHGFTLERFAAAGATDIDLDQLRQCFPAEQSEGSDGT